MSSSDLWLSLAVLAVALVAGYLYLRTTIGRLRAELLDAIGPERERLVEQIAGLSGPGLITARPPREVMAALISDVYGHHEANEDVITGVLGGAGTAPRGGDLTVSSHTSVDIAMSRVADSRYRFSLATSYRFKAGVDRDSFLIFVTCNAELRDRILTGCSHPLFESWYIPDEELFEDSVRQLVDSVTIGIDYVDEMAQRKTVDPSRVQLSPVQLREWPELLSFFRPDTSSPNRLDAHEYLDSLQIYECDLNSLIPREHDVQHVDGLRIQTDALYDADDGFCYWQAPYPCFMERISFDATDLPDHDDWKFKIVPFTLRSGVSTPEWSSAENLAPLVLNSWLLPGHGVLLFWKN